jgi:hypothetical protein
MIVLNNTVIINQSIHLWSLLDAIVYGLNKYKNRSRPANQLTQWRRVVLEFLLVARLVNRFSVVCETWKIIFIFTRARQSWATWIQATIFCSTFISIMISSHLSLGLLNVLCISHMFYSWCMFRGAHQPWTDHINNTQQEYKILIFSL